MNEKLLEIIDSIIELTTLANLKWDDGSEEGEFYLNFKGRGFLLSYNNAGDVYTFTILNEEGNKAFSVPINESDNKLFNATKKLYAIASTSNERAGQTIDELLEFIKSNIEEEKKIPQMR